MSVKIKLCGLTDEASVRAAIAAKADYVGFVHFPTSPRHIAFERAAELKKLVPETTGTVAVLVDPDDALLCHMQDTLRPHYVQLHGQETPQRLRDIRQAFSTLNIIKAIRIHTADDVARAAAFAECAEALLFDARPPDGMLPGGNGMVFDWALLRHREFPLPWFLSGGLNADNVADAILMTGAKMIDVSSGIESAPGVKDATLIEAFVKAARHET